MILAVCLLIFFLIAGKVFLNKTLKHANSTTVLYCSENFIIIDKQSDFKINSNHKDEKTVQTFLKQKFPDLANNKLFHEFYFPHRLDYATSGILCIPKTKAVCKLASQAFFNRSTRKYYIALVRGLVSQTLVDINVPIGDDTREVEIQKMCTVYESAFCSKARAAQTIVATLEEGLLDNYPATKILCRLITGRRHQIRVHCSCLGHTIVGDYTYSNRKDVSPTRMYLHSLRLVLPNSIENLDVSTRDPFAAIQNWQKVRTVQDLSMAFKEIDNYVKSLDLS